MGRKVLVTGAGGFIGSHLAERLVEEGYEVQAMIRYTSRASAGNLEFVEKKILSAIEIIRGDLKDPDFCWTAVAKCDVVFHLAALTSVPGSYINPMDYMQANAMGTTNLLTAALRRNRLSRFVQLSSSEVYGTAAYVPMDERHALAAQSPYAASKICSEKIAESFYRSFGLPVTILRPFNTFGPRQSARAVIPTIISQLCVKNATKLGNVNPKRDFLYVRDTVSGLIQVGLHRNSCGECMNLGSGKGISIADLHALIAKLMGKKVKVIRDKRRVRPKTSEVSNLLADARKAKRLTGWNSKVSLEEGLQGTIDWIKAHQHFYHPDDYMT